MKRRIAQLGRIAAMVLGAASVPAIGVWMIPDSVPVGRLVMNLTAYTKEHPDDAEGFYLLGRAHGLAFVKKADEINVWKRMREDGKALPSISDESWQHDRSWGNPDDPKPVITNEWLVAHMSGAVRAFDRALELEKKSALYHIGYAYVLETGMSMAEKADVVPGCTPLKELDAAKRSSLEALVLKLKSESSSERESAERMLRAQFKEGAAAVLLANRDNADATIKDTVHRLLSDHWRDTAIEHYFQAFDLAFPKDRTIEEQPMRGLSTLTSYESGRAFVRLMKARGTRNDEEKERLTRVEDGIRELDAKPQNMAITPIIFSFEPARSLASLLDPARTVFFDLDGDGIPEARPWVRPGTSLLVWDPDRTGQITSGRQLFGSVTWWFFFTDGYRALDALDDNRDRLLSGAELAGLGVWTDLDADGVSDPGEVVPIEHTPITAVRTSFSSFELDCPAEALGLTMRDGSCRATYDWIVPYVEAAPPTPLAERAWVAGNSPRRAPVPRDLPPAFEPVAIVGREREDGERA